MVNNIFWVVEPPLQPSHAVYYMDPNGIWITDIYKAAPFKTQGEATEFASKQPHPAIAREHIWFSPEPMGTDANPSAIPSIKVEG